MDSSQSATSWGAIIAGAIAAAALTLVLISLGSAVGFSSISPWPSSGASAKTFQISTGLYFVFTAMVTSTIGGYISGRLRSKWTGIHSYEVQFRDTAHGFLAWALATIAGAAALASAATFLAGGAAAGATAGISSQSGESVASNYYVALLMRPTSAQPSVSTSSGASTGSSPAAPTSQARAVLAHNLATLAQTPSSDRAYLAQLVSMQTGANQAEAEKRVDEVLNQARTDADESRKVAASISIWLTIAMFVGAFSASLAAIEGGQLRDRRWRGVIGSRAYNEARIET